MMTGYNHISIGDLDLALIQGTKVTALCMITFTPRLRVGSGGQCNEPSWPTCPKCDRVKQLLIARRKLRDEINRLTRELRPIEKEKAELWAGRPLREVDAPRKVTA